MVRRRVVLGLIAVGMVAAPLAACSPPPSENRVVYGMEAENDQGWCLPEAQSAIAGMLTTRAMFDPLTVPDDKGDYVPFLAKAITHNKDFTRWTITLRKGVTFHDGSPLDAAVVKNNLDAYRGAAYANRAPLLFLFVFENVADVQVKGQYRVEVTAKTPWPAFPAFLNLNNRFGIMAQSQLDDQKHCDTRPVGTGPFMFDSWKPGERLIVKKNPDYWIKGYPLLDEMEFRPVPDPDARLNGLLGDELDVMHTSDDIQVDDLGVDADTGNVNLYATYKFTELSYVMFNSSKLPFSNKHARLALAYGGDRNAINKAFYAGLAQLRNGPFPKGSPGYVADPGFPEFDLQRAKKEAALYEKDTGKKLRFTLATVPSVMGLAQLIQQMAADAGVEVTIKSLDQAQLINAAINGEFEAMFFRNHPGTEPDLQYVWWSDGPVNFARFNAKDEQGNWTQPGGKKINDLLLKARSELDPAKRDRLYQQVNRIFSRDVFNIWAYSSHWGVATAPDVQGILGPQNPDGSVPFPGLATGHPLHGLCCVGVSCPDDATVEQLPESVTTID